MDLGGEDIAVVARLNNIAGLTSYLVEDLECDLQGCKVGCLTRSARSLAKNFSSVHPPERAREPMVLGLPT